MGRKKNIKSDRNTGPDGRKRFKFWNYYDDKEFDTEEQLIQYQRQRHFRCPDCEVKAHSAPALAVHYEQVHGKTLRGVPNAIPGRDDPRVLIIGLKGVPADMLMSRASGTDFEEDALRIVKQEMAKQGHLTPLNMVGGSSSHPGPASRTATPGVSGGHQAAASTGVLPGMTNNGTMNGMGMPMPGMGNKMPGGMNMPGMGMPGGMGGMQGGMPGMPNMAGMAGMMPGGMNPMLMGMMGMMPGMGTPGMPGMQMPGAAAPGGGSADASSSASKPVANTAPTSVQLQLPATGSSLEEKKDGAGTPAAAQEEHDVHPGKTANPPEVVRSTVVGDNPFAKDAAPSAAAASATPGSAGEVGAPPATAANSGTSSGTGEPQAASTSTSTMPSSGAPGPGAGGAAMPGMMKGMMPGMGMPGMMAGMGMGMPGGGMNPMMMGMMPGMMKGMPMMPGMMPGMPPMPGMMHPGMKGPGMMPMMPPGGPMGMKGGSKNPNLQPLGNPGGGGPSSGVGGAPQLAASSSSGSGAPVSAAGEQSHMMKGSVSTSTAPFKNMDGSINPPAAAKSRPPFAGGGANNPNLIPLGSGGAGLGGGPGGSYSGPPAPGAAAPQPSGSIAGGGGRTPVGVGGAGGASSGSPGAGGTTNNQHEQQLKMGLSGKATAPRPAHNGYHDRESQSPLRERSPRREPNDYDQPQKRQVLTELFYILGIVEIMIHRVVQASSRAEELLHGDEYKKQTLENAKQALFYAYEFVSPEELRACQKPWNRPVRFAETGK
eukprot:g192.t1